METSSSRQIYADNRPVFKPIESCSSGVTEAASSFVSPRANYARIFRPDGIVTGILVKHRRLARLNVCSGTFESLGLAHGLANSVSKFGDRFLSHAIGIIGMAVVPGRACGNDSIVSFRELSAIVAFRVPALGCS